MSETAALDHGLSRLGAGEPTLTDKVEFLSRPDAYPHPVGEVILRETHMSWVRRSPNRPAALP